MWEIFGGIVAVGTIIGFMQRMYVKKIKPIIKDYTTLKSRISKLEKENERLVLDIEGFEKETRTSLARMQLEILKNKNISSY